MRKLRLYLTGLMIVLILHYLVPYTILKESRDFALFFFWIALASLWALATAMYIEKRV